MATKPAKKLPKDGNGTKTEGGEQPKPLDFKQRLGLFVGDNIWHIVVFLFIGGFYSFFVNWIGLSFVLFGVVVLILAVGLKKLPADPPTKGQVTVWGKRMDETVVGFDPEIHVKDEGWVLLFPYFPFFYDVIPIDFKMRNLDFIFENVRCRLSDITKTGKKRTFDRKKIAKMILEMDKETKRLQPESGGEIRVQFGVTYEPDKTRISKFINYGKDKGIEDILRDVLGEDVRQAGMFLTWEQYSFATDALAVRFFREITGIDPLEGELLRVKQFLKRALVNGQADVHDMGIKLRRINILPIKPMGKLENAAESAAKEIQERRGEVFETNVDVERAKILYDAYMEVGEKKSFDECLLEIRQRRTIREGKGQVFEIPGLVSAAHALSGVISGMTDKPIPPPQRKRKRRRKIVKEIGNA